MLLALGLVAVLYLMAYDRREMADYGLIVSRNWRRHALLGLGLGGAFYLSYLAVSLRCDVFEWTTEHVTAARVGKTLLAGLAALMLAPAQQVIFSGYLPNSLRERCRLPTAAAVLASSILFGVCGGMAETGGLFSPRGAGLAVGLALIAALLCQSRLLLGSLSFPAGLLAGAIIIRRLVGTLRLLDFQPGSPYASLLAPNGDPRQGPLMWAALCLPICGLSLALLRRGPWRPPADQPAIDASFKRVMPFSNLLGLAPLDIWGAKLWQARFRIGPAYLPRAIVATTASAVNTVLTAPERLLAPLAIRHDVPDPVFIVGVHRSGTTHLHNLLSQDPRFCTPRNYQVYNPHGFLTGWLTTLALGPFLTMRRPMDGVQLSAFSPQEEEFALACMSRCSPYWAACFPRLHSAHERFIYPDQMTAREWAAWSRQLVRFLRKVTFWSRKRPLLKSPYNTARVAALKELFPRAKFIHIVRHPHATYRSNMRLAEHGWAVFQVQDADPADSYASHFLENYRRQEECYYRDTAGLPAENCAELKFEDLEDDPIGVLQRIYGELNLEFTPAFRRRLERYLASIAGYRKTRFAPLPPEQQLRVDAAMGELARRWGYQDDPAERSLPRAA